MSKNYIDRRRFIAATATAAAVTIVPAAATHVARRGSRPREVVRLADFTCRTTDYQTEVNLLVDCLDRKVVN